MKALIDIRELRVSKREMTICHVRELQVATGERVSIIGENGSGKTTLLRVIGALEKQYEGRCHVEVVRRERVYVHQSPYLFRGTVLVNMTYGLAAHRIPRRDQVSIALQGLVTFGVDHLAHRQCDSLSGGERRRIALARAFALQPNLLLLDEPLADLDQAGIDIVCRAIDELSRSTILISSPVALPTELKARVYQVNR